MGQSLTVAESLCAPCPGEHQPRVPYLHPKASGFGLSRLIAWASVLSSSPMILERLRQLCVHWGGSLDAIEAEAFRALVEDSYSTRKKRTFFGAPFADGLGVNWEAKRVLYVPDEPQVTIAGIIHEMGHVFACAEPPEKSQEVQFFGWEYTVAKLVRHPVAQWAKENKDYVLTVDGQEVGGLTAWGLRVQLRDRVQVATDLGLIVAKRPVAIR